MRLLTRSDFDGLACAVLLVEAGIVDSYKFVHPKDVQDGKIKATKDDVLANIPFIEGCGLWFDHHASEEERLELQKDVHYEGDSREAPSCARVIYDYYGGAEKFSRMDETGLMAAVDKSDSADFTVDEILNPSGWILLSFIMDARTGLGRYHDYRISNYMLMEEMIQFCRTMTAEEILKNPDVIERTSRFVEQQETYVAMVKANTRVEDNIVILDLRNVEEIVSGNRFVIYSLFPDTNISIRVIWGRLKQNVVLTVGHSITNRTCQTNVGSLMLMYGGGGHPKVGTCQIPTPNAERSLREIIEHIKADQ